MRFSIRDLLLVTVIVALAAGWWVDRSRLARRDAEWEEQFDDAIRLLSKESNIDRTFYPPGGIWSVNRKSDLENGTGIAPINDLNLPNSSAPALKLPSD